MVGLRTSTLVVFTVLFCAFISSTIVKGVQVAESDITITEGSTRQIFVRRQNRDSSMSLTVFVTTVEGYKRQQTQCNTSLSRVLNGRNESQIDPAEDDDFSTREYNLQFEREQFEVSLTLEVVDDIIAENDEIFIIYTSIIEGPEDRCASAVLLHDNDEVLFNFSTPLVTITEGGDLPSMLSIIKYGQNEPDISFRVTITEGTPQLLNEMDYTPNIDHVYVFTNATNELPIATQLREDQSGESIETFFIYLPPLPEFSPQKARPVIPSEVQVMIIDDDSVLLGFVDSNSSVILTEGGENQEVCVDIKPEGLLLDPFDYIPLTIRTESLDGEVGYGQESFTFQDGRTITCKTIYATDDRVSDGTQTSRLIIDAQRLTTVPFEIFPQSIPITIIDDDVISFKLVIDTNQSRGGPQAPPSLIEGDKTQNFIKIVRNGSTIFAYNVTLKVEPLTESSDPSKILIAPVIMAVSDNETGVRLEIPDNLVSEKVMRYGISIANIEPFEPGKSTPSQGVHTRIVGDGIKLLVYDNDYDIGFPSSSARVAEEQSTKRVCVMLDTSGIPPTLTIPLSITIQNTSSIGDLLVSTRQITLSSASNNACFDMEFLIDNDVCDQSPRSYTVQLTLMTSDLGYNFTVNFLQQTITIEIDDAQDCASAVCVACIVVPIILILLIIILLIAAVLIYWRYKKHSKRYHPQDIEEKRNKYLDYPLEKAAGNELVSTNTDHKGTPQNIYS